MIKLPKDRHGNTGWAVKARKPHRCEVKNYGCKHWIESGEHYYRAIAFPDGDINNGTGPWAMKICRHCLADEMRAEFDAIVSTPAPSKLRVVHQSADVLVLGTDQIREAADFAGLSNDKGIFWEGSFSGLVARRNGRWVWRSDYMPPKDARPAVTFVAVHFPEPNDSSAGDTPRKDAETGVH